MIKVTDYLIYVREMDSFKEIFKTLNKKFGYKHQYAFESHCGSVTEQYDGNGHLSRRTKSIIGNISIYDEQKKGIEYLQEHQKQFKNIYSFVDMDVAEELFEKYPRILEAKKRFDWGYEATQYMNYPREREENCDICKITCWECIEDFKVFGSEHELDGEKLQCPHCKEEIEIEIEYIANLSGRKSRH